MRVFRALLLILVSVALVAAEADGSTPVPVPDEFGLGERLALIDWLQARQVPIPDRDDLPALRRAYLQQTAPATPPAAPAVADQERERIVLDLWRRHGINAAPDRATSDLTAQLERLDAERARADQALLDEQRRLSEASPPPVRTVAPVPAGSAAPAAGPAPAAITVRPLFPWDATERNASYRTYRLLRQRLLEPFLAQDHRQHPWAGQAAQYLERLCVLMADPLGEEQADAAGPRLDAVLAAGCDDPLILAWKIPPFPHKGNDDAKAMVPFHAMVSRLATATCDPFWRFEAIDSWMSQYVGFLKNPATNPEVAKAMAIYTEAAVAVLREPPRDRAWQDFVLRKVFAGSYRVYSVMWMPLYDALAPRIERLELEPWTAATVHGMLALRTAQWHWTGITSAENREPFRIALHQARQHLQEAWELKPTLSLPARLMLVFGNQSQTDDEFVARWYQRAQGLEPDHPETRNLMVKASSDAWGGSHQGLMEVGRRALAGGDFASETPWTYAEAYRMVAHWQQDRRDASRPLLWDEQAWKDLATMYEGYLSSSAFSRLRPWFATRYVDAAERAGKRGTADQLRRRYGLRRPASTDPEPTDTYQAIDYKKTWYVRHDAPDQLWYGPYHGMIGAQNAAARANETKSPPPAPRDDEP